jgi:protein-S-isoprenylcysteine O-methyltransferase Ste14
MSQPYETAISALWLAWLAYWLISAASVKPVLRTEGTASRIIYSLPLWVGGWLLLGGGHFGALDVRFVPDASGTAIVGTVVTAAGLGFAVWARIALGGNWSGMVTVKQGHELVERGPYSIVRHPIYTGLILALLGTAGVVGEWRALLALALVVGSFWYKLRTEERMMRETFGAAYVEYSRRVKALVPFLI